MGFNRVIGSSLKKHATQLAASEDSDFHGAKIGFQKGIFACEDLYKKLSLSRMRPDYSHKTFRDQRGHYTLLMETLAMGV